MDVPRPSSAACRSVPAKPDSSLAEWTSKIKALQRQVDDDDEAETRRLEEEIAESRRARIRRSANYGSRANSVASSPIKGIDQSMVSDEPLSVVEKESNQDDALKKLMGEGTPARRNNRSPVSPSPLAAPASAVNKRSSSPISLAAFIGGRATGPKLTQHRPQQDAHDPTQFEQRTEISAPHPVFGRGGVAMPGMTGNGKASKVSRAIREEEAQLSEASSPLSQRDRRISTSTTTIWQKREQECGREPQIRPNYTGRSSGSRQRTISTPTGPSPKLNQTDTPTTLPKQDPVARPLSYSPSPINIGSLVHQSDSKSPAPRPSSAGLRTPPPPSPTPSKATGLAGPIQPSPRPFGPQIPSFNKSPAFNKPPPSKDPTPSLSRLQGRGFVKTIVEKSASLDVASPEGTPSPGRRQSTVLTRWQHVTGDSSPQPVMAPKPMQMRKSFTVDSGSSLPITSSYSIPLKRENTEPVLRSKSSLPSLQAMKTGESVASSVVSEGGHAGPRLGSAKTVITFIQSTTTGDRPTSPPQSRPEADELGLRVRTRTTSSGLVQERGEAGLPAGKALSHPTKDRAKKPRKGRSAAVAASSSTLAAIREASPTRDEPALTTSWAQVAEPHAVPSLPPPQPFTPVRTTSPMSLYPSPPTTRGRAISPALDVPPKPSFNSILTPTLVSISTESNTTSPLAPPPAAPSPSVTPPQSTAQKVPPSPARHTRIPSTGNRATVMDVAQAFTEALQRQPSPSASSELTGPPPPSYLATSAKEEVEEEDEYTPPSVKDLVSSWGPRSTSMNGPHSDGVNGSAGSSATTTTITAPPLEKRKSSYEKYSAFILPPLTEERTPVPSPVGTLKLDAVLPAPELLEEEKSPAPQVEEFMVSHELVVDEAPSAAADIEQSVDNNQEVIHLVHVDEPLPHVNIDALYHTPRSTYNSDPDVMTISVEVLAILGNIATAINTDAHIFYDSELLALVHRAKDKASGLVTTKLWAWYGRRAQPGDRESQKVQELARRYVTAPISVQQAREPPEFVSVLGGKLAIRQGTRAHWSAENTAMHVVRSSQGVIFIDEVDLTIKNLCSGFSYCISILDTFYVWHGRGSTIAERRAAREYAQALAPAAESIVELTEDESQADEMFWMILGEREYAKADYWRWRAGAPFVDPRVWVVNASLSDLVRSVSAFPSNPEFNREVFLVDCIWELFIVVGSEARGRRLDIRLALHVAEGLARKATSTRPFTPPVHALIFPTQIPTDLLLTFRDLDESDLNAGHVPDHMNLIPAGDAELNLKSTTWPSAALQDLRMLPLGGNPTNKG